MSHRPVERVLVVANAYPDDRRPYYGAYVHTAVCGLRALGVEVDVLYVPGYRGRGEYLRGARRALELNRRRRHDVVHAYHGLAGTLARLQVRAPLVVTFVGDDVLGATRPDGSVGPTTRALAASLRRLAWVADATITRTEEMARVLPSRRRGRNHVIPGGVDLDRFGRLRRDEARARLGWDPSAPIVLFPADPARAVKNHPLAAAAVSRLAQEVPGVRLEVAATLPPELVPAAMAGADAVVFTSHVEGSPNVIKEAMAEEVPIVSVPVGDVPRWIDGVPGCRLCAPEPEAVAAGLRAALAEGRVPGARAAVASLGLAEVSRRVLGVYEEVVVA